MYMEKADTMLSSPRDRHILPRLRVPLALLAAVSAALPLAGLAFCLVWSVAFAHEYTTRTHCDVENILPSISSAVGMVYPQYYIWRLAVVAHAGPRLLVVWGYHRYYEVVLRQAAKAAGRAACCLHLVEVASLIGLTLRSSAENYRAHVRSLVVFVASSQAHMVLAVWLQACGRGHPPRPTEARALRFKRKLMAADLAAFGLAGYCFCRHNWYCEPYMYSIFAFCEYTLVLANTAFHASGYWELSPSALVLGGPVGLSVLPPTPPSPPAIHR
ncbi:Post-GPI attachment to proteins factor 2 [Gryllus bimaculatus]|nr:Post-GPI attachment to proteins factor 2 [Gryllus bimaculatus]